LRAFVVEAFKIPSGSMIPTLQVGDHIFVNKFLYGLRIPFTHFKFFEWRKPHAGEVIVFIYPKEPWKDFIKRVVAVEGDTIEVHNDVVFVNGKQVPHRMADDGPYRYYDFNENLERWEVKYARHYEEELGGEKFMTLVDTSHPTPGSEFPAYVVPPGHVFVLGDNRSNSLDSRYWGPVPLENIRGKAMVGHQSIEDVWTLLDHLQLLEHVLDQEIDMEDALGTEGWRHHMQAVEAGWKR